MLVFGCWVSDRYRFADPVPDPALSSGSEFRGSELPHAAKNV